MKNVILVLTALSLVICYSCKKEEEPEIKTIEYTVKGRITPIQGDSNFYWPNVWCRLYVSYDDYLSPTTYDTEMFRADSLGFVNLKYINSEERSIDYIYLEVHSDSLHSGFKLYCRVVPYCDIDTTYFYYDDTRIEQGGCN